MKIGDEVYIHGYVDEIRKDTVIIRNEGGYFGTAHGEVIVVYNSAHPNWIPCSERLPDIGDIYIVLVDEKQLRPNESRVACAYWLDDKWQYGVLESYEHKMPKLVIEPLEELTVVAWMPLPEPYEGDDHAD